jgi:hypothetical protein
MLARARAREDFDENSIDNIEEYENDGGVALEPASRAVGDNLIFQCT